MSSDGIVAVKQTQQTVDSSIFFEFVRGSPLPNLQPFDGTNPHSVVVMDNCSVHRVEEVKELFREAGVLLLFLPQTSLPLSYCLPKLNTTSNNTFINAIPDPGPVITAAFNAITSENCLAWAKHCGYGQ